MKTMVKKACPICGKKQQVMVDEDKLKKFRTTKCLIQDVFPELNEDEREILLSGICPECWEKAGE